MADVFIIDAEFGAEADIYPPFIINAEFRAESGVIAVVTIYPPLVTDAKFGAAAGITGAATIYPASPPNPALNVTFQVNNTTIWGEGGIGGYLPWTNIANAEFGAKIGIEGLFALSFVTNVFGFSVCEAGINADFYVNFQRNFVAWSKIGRLDFTIDRTNEAGTRPLDWKGFVYSVKKLGNRVIAYGENGVSILNPAGTAYGLSTIYRVGLKSKNAVAGTENVHWFVDKGGQLWELSEELKKLDYSEYLSTMGDITLSYDKFNNALYICDGSQGYIYRDGSLGKCSVNLTGIDSQSGALYVVADTDISVPIFEICTDIYDMGTRKGKTITGFEIGTNLSGTLSAAIDYRRDMKSEFICTPWHYIQKGGRVFMTAYGREFRFRVKSNEPSWEYFELDWITVIGKVHNS